MSNSAFLTILVTIFLSAQTKAFGDQSGCCKHANTNIEVSASAVDELRIVRPVSQPFNHFIGLEPGFSFRWLRNLRQPSFCTMALCHGTCAAPTRSARSPSNLGMPSLSSNLPNQMTNVQTPCGLKGFDQILKEKSIDQCESLM
jgi:hypothetical protein